MTDEIRPKGLRRRGLLKALLALPILLSFRPANPRRIADGEGAPDDLVEVNGWILRRSDLS